MSSYLEKFGHTYQHLLQVKKRVANLACRACPPGPSECLFVPPALTVSWCPLSGESLENQRENWTYLSERRRVGVGLSRQLAKRLQARFRQQIVLLSAIMITNSATCVLYPSGPFLADEAPGAHGRLGLAR